MLAVQKTVNKLPVKLGYTWEKDDPQVVVLIDLSNKIFRVPMELCRDREVIS